MKSLIFGSLSSQKLLGVTIIDRLWWDLQRARLPVICSPLVFLLASGKEETTCYEPTWQLWEASVRQKDLESGIIIAVRKLIIVMIRHHSILLLPFNMDHTALTFSLRSQFSIHGNTPVKQVHSCPAIK